MCDTLHLCALNQMALGVVSVFGRSTMRVQVMRYILKDWADKKWYASLEWHWWSKFSHLQVPFSKNNGLVCTWNNKDERVGCWSKKTTKTWQDRRWETKWPTFFHHSMKKRFYQPRNDPGSIQGIVSVWIQQDDTTKNSYRLLSRRRSNFPIIPVNLLYLGVYCRADTR